MSDNPELIVSTINYLLSLLKDNTISDIEDLFFYILNIFPKDDDDDINKILFNIPFDLIKSKINLKKLRDAYNDNVKLNQWIDLNERTHTVSTKLVRPNSIRTLGTSATSTTSTTSTISSTMPIVKTSVPDINSNESLKDIYKKKYCINDKCVYDPTIVPIMINEPTIVSITQNEPITTTEKSNPLIKFIKKKSNVMDVPRANVYISNINNLEILDVGNMIMPEDAKDGDIIEIYDNKGMAVIYYIDGNKLIQTKGKNGYFLPYQALDNIIKYGIDYYNNSSAEYIIIPSMYSIKYTNDINNTTRSDILFESGVDYGMTLKLEEPGMVQISNKNMIITFKSRYIVPVY